MCSTRTEPAARSLWSAWLRKPRSIAGRLGVLYIGSTTILLLSIAGYLHWSLHENLARQDRALVAGKLQVLRLLLRDEYAKADLLASEVEHEASANEVLKYYLRVLDEGGGVMHETSGMADVLTPAAFPAPVPLAQADGAIERELSPGRHFLLLSGAAVTGPSGSEKRVVQIALDVAHNRVILADCSRNLLAVIGVGIVFAAATSAFVTRAGLRPLRTMARKAQCVTASKLDNRMIATQWPAELRELASAFDAMLDRLQGSFDRLKEFTADIAHALRNPINNLRGETEVALARARTPEDYRQVLGSSLEEFERLSRLIEGLLFIARADDPRTATDRVCFDVRCEMDAVQEFYDALAADQGVTVTCDGAAEIRGDPMLVRRAISNLLANALKHTPAGGRVTMAARCAADGTVEIRTTDTGCGIASEHLPKVFDRFYQVDKTRDTTTKGSGLGLAIVQSIMRLHGGTASLESAAGRGTTVILRFPRTCAVPRAGTAPCALI